MVKRVIMVNLASIVNTKCRAQAASNPTATQRVSRQLDSANQATPGDYVLITPTGTKAPEASGIAVPPGKFDLNPSTD